MKKSINLLAFSGSARTASWNKKLVTVAAEGAREAGADVTVADLKEYPMPVYDQDLQAEQGMDPNAEKLQALFKAADGFIIASPEHNGTYSTLLKNVIDWVTRSGEGSTDLTAVKGKTAVIMSTSPGGLGGYRGLVQLRAFLGNISMIVLPEQKAVPQAAKAFTEEGRLADDETHQAVKALGARLADVTDRLRRD